MMRMGMFKHASRLQKMPSLSRFHSVLGFNSGDASLLELQRSASLPRTFGVVEKEITMGGGFNYFLFHLKNLNQNQNIAQLKKIEIVCPSLPFQSVLASCGGLVLVLNNFFTGGMALLDTTTLKYHIIPPNPAGNANVYFYGFGGVRGGNHYKVVTIIDKPSPGFPFLDLMIYDVKASGGTWRRVQSRPDGFAERGNIFLPMNYANHCLYFFAPPQRDKNVIRGFDLEQEEFFETWVPCEPEFEIAGLDGNLCLVEKTYEKYDIWVTKEKKVTKEKLSSCWTRLFSISNPGATFNLADFDHDPGSLRIEDNDYVSLLPLCYSSCRKKILFDVEMNLLSWYDLETKEFEDFIGDTPFKVKPIGWGQF